MWDTLSNYLKQLSTVKSKRIRVLSVLLALSILVSANVFWMLRKPGMTMAGDATCGLEEHVHGEECKQQVLICGFDVDEEAQPAVHTHNDECYTTTWVEEQTLTECICGDETHEHIDTCYQTTTVEAHEVRTLTCTEETPTAHTHGETCYDWQIVCDKPEHIHTLTCYSDENADVETQLDWQDMFSSYATGELPADLVSLARAQIGYAESTRNFQLDADGNRSGYTRYGAWYGSPYSDWSALFVSFCLHYAGADEAEMPLNLGANAMAQLWESAGRYAAVGQVQPAAGDLVFFNNNTVAIISDAAEDTLTVVQGDWDHAVAERTVSILDDTIAGYGLVATQPTAPINEGEFVLADCDCGAGNDAAWSQHVATCALYTQINTLLSEKTAQEIYDLWPQLPQSAKDYVLEFGELSINADKLAELKNLLGIVEGWSEQTIYGGVSGVTFTLQGLLPVGASLDVVPADDAVAQQAVVTAVNPNNYDLVHDRFVYDLVLCDGSGNEIQPTQPLDVSVKFENLTVAEDDFLRVAHLDDAGAALSDEIIEVDNGVATFTAEGFSPYLFYTIAMESEGGERILSTAWMKLRDSGWFNYWEQFLTDEGEEEPVTRVESLNTDINPTSDPSDVQVNDWGGETESEDKKVTVSKTIDGTDLENVFDITLTVKTEENIAEIYKEPDMAVVIVMDVSNTMNDSFTKIVNGEEVTVDAKTRYQAAMEAAEQFVDKFAEQGSELSQIGFVAFNTDAHRIFDMQTCDTTAKATSLKNTMRKGTKDILFADGYGDSHSRFTNMEAGLKRAQDMLKNVTNKNKYIIFLTDGFPTTYVSSGYNGWDPYSPYANGYNPGKAGVFYDYVSGKYCHYGTSYSDKAAIKARDKAAEIKGEGTHIFSVGVNVGGQTIDQYDTHRGHSFSVIDRTGESYEIGSEKDPTAFKQWLGGSIGSGFTNLEDKTDFYYDAESSTLLTSAFDTIFDKIHELREDAAKADWVAQDPMPLPVPEKIEFIGFYTRDDVLTGNELVGSAAENAENSATMTLMEARNMNQTIDWDLKKSGYQKVVEQTGDNSTKTTYYYKLKYRVRLRNEQTGSIAFEENKSYYTNDETYLNYRLIETVDGKTQLSDPKRVDFEIPQVHGYLAELTFTKKDVADHPLAGAQFTLAHDGIACDKCRGDGTPVTTIPDQTATSDANGQVTFTNIPSGHIYTLTETVVPTGYVANGNTYSVTVAYDAITVTVKDKSGTVLVDQQPLKDWDKVIINIGSSVQLPTTGGFGAWPYVVAGMMLIVLSAVLGVVHRRRTQFGQKGSRAP